MSSIVKLISSVFSRFISFNNNCVVSSSVTSLKLAVPSSMLCANSVSPPGPKSSIISSVASGVSPAWLKCLLFLSSITFFLSSTTFSLSSTTFFLSSTSFLFFSTTFFFCKTNKQILKAIITNH